MHGIIFLALEDFISSHLGDEAWPRAMAAANLAEQDFAPDMYYPDQAAMDLFEAAAKLLDMSQAETLELFGRHMAPGLVEMGRSIGIVHKNWKTMDILEHLHNDILMTFSSPDAGIQPPDIRTYRFKHGGVALAYVSKRKLCHLMKGIIMGMGEYFDEPIAFKEPICMLNHSPLCRLSVFLDDPRLQRYVDIQREFEIIHSRIDEIKFYNQFNGIPFSSAGLVLRYDHEEVLVQSQKDQLVAMEKQGVVYIAVHHLPLGLKATVKAVNLAQGTAILNQFSLTDGAVGQRYFKRVSPEEFIPIKIVLEGWEHVGQIRNLSGGGVAVRLKKHNEFSEMNLFFSVQLKFTVPLKWIKFGDTIELGPLSVCLDGNILDIVEEGDERLVRIIFSPLSAHDLSLMDQYFQTQRDKAVFALKKLLPV